VMDVRHKRWSSGFGMVATAAAVVAVLLVVGTASASSTSNLRAQATPTVVKLCSRSGSAALTSKKGACAKGTTVVPGPTTTYPGLGKPGPRGPAGPAGATGPQGPVGTVSSTVTTLFDTGPLTVLGAATFGAVVQSGDLTINTSKFHVTAATGDT